MGLALLLGGSLLGLLLCLSRLLRLGRLLDLLLLRLLCLLRLGLRLLRD